MKPVLRVLAGAAIAAGLMSSANAQVPGVTATEIRIGSFGPITGANFSFGKLPMIGLEATFEKINAAGGINGRKLVLVREDDQCDPANAIAVVRKLIHNSNVFAIVGGSCSNGVNAAKPDIIEAKIPFVNFAAASNAISAPKVDNIFTTMLTSNLESKLQVAYLQDQKFKRVALIAQKDAWGRDRYDSFTAEAKAKGLELVADEELSMEANDGTAQVLKIQSSKPDAVVMLLYPKPAAIFLRDSSRLAFKSAFIGQSVISDPITFYSQVNIPGATDQFITISPMRYPFDDAAVADWRKRINAVAPGEKDSAWNLYGIVAGQVVAEALTRAGKDLTREGFIKAMNDLNDFTVDMSAGKMQCSDHQCAKSAAWLRRTPDGKIEVVSTTSLK